MAQPKKTRRIPIDSQGNPAIDGNKETRRAIQNQGWSKRVQVAKQKKKILDLLTEGYSVEDCMNAVGLTPATYAYYKRSDQDFRDESNLIIERRSGKNLPDRFIPFEAFSEKYLKQRLFRHQLQWIDLIEGREPRELHEGQRYEPGDPDNIIVNTPPGHAKSTTLTMNYVTYKIVTNPSFRVVVVSKTETMAKKFLAGIKRRLTNIYYRELIRDFAPPEGFEASAEMWSSSMIYFSHQEGGEKDPTVQALGIGQQIYGARADLIILDDVEDLRNVSEVEKHVEWVQQEVMTRDAPIIIVGTRVGAVDIYTELLNPKRYEDEESVWTYLTQPAVLAFGETPDDWVTLWPRSNQPHSRHPGEQDENGLWEKWSGKRLDKVRRGMSPRMWSLVYMQARVEEDAIFPEKAVLASMTRNRGVGLIPWGWHGYDTDRQNKHYVIAGLDPASAAGYTAIVVLSVDRDTGKRYLLDVRNAHMTPEKMRSEIRDVTERYSVQEWRVEKNSFQSFLTQDREINQYMAARGVRFNEHLTGKHNKWDPSWGVASMAQLFVGWEDGFQMIELPGRTPTEAVKTLTEQLITWSPDIPKTQRTDTVMALWFAEIRAREVCMVQTKAEFADNPYLSDNDMDARLVINIDDYMLEQRMAM